jgi:hypothetical protein
LRGRSGRKGPNPLTRSYESNGPDVKIRGTAQHVAEKYLQLARDAQSSGDTIMAESLLQHAEHYFRLIAAAQVQQQAPNGGFGRQSADADTDFGDDDDDFSGLPDRFAPLAERLPPPPANFAPQGQPYQAPQPAAHFAPPQLVQPQPQPFEERPFGGGEPRHERPARHDRPYNDRNRDRGRDRESGDRPQGDRSQNGFDRNRDNRRFPPRIEQPSSEQPTPREASRAADPAIGLPAFITAPVIPAPSRAPETEAPVPFAPEDRGAPTDREPVGFHLASRRRRRPRPAMDEANDAESPPQTNELPLGD